MDLQLADETVLVTGAGQGLGRAIGLAFAEEGARVAFHYNSSAEGAQKAAAEVNAAGGAALAVHADLRDDAAVEAAAEQVESALGPISVLVNNAAATQRKRFLDTTAQDWQAQVDVTVTGMLRITHAVARRMAERDRGSIVSLLGDSGRVGESGILVTATTRSSTVGLTKSLAKELARHQIRANAVSIALVQTDSLDAHTGMREGADDERMRKILAQYPLRRLGRPEDVVPMVLLLASPLSSWTTGQIISVNGGYAMQPVLARDKARFAGEAVAAVVADSRYLAEDALALIDVDYAPLPVTVSAWKAGAEVPVHDEAPNNVLLARTFTTGDVAAAFARADLVLERDLITNRHAGNPLECRAGVALWHPERRRLTFWSGTQVPHIVRNMLADLLGLAESSIIVIAPDVGGGFGVKSVLYPEDVALCLMALVRIGHTDESLWGFGAFSSRQSVIGGGAAQLAGQAVRDRALRLAAGLLDAKTDELVLSGGQIFVNGDERPSLHLYLMPTSAEIPELVIGHVANPAANPLGVRGVGEGGTLGPAAALAGAVGDALGVAVDRLPITPSSLWELIQQKLTQ